MCDVVDNEWLITTPSADLGTTADLRHAAADVVVLAVAVFVAVAFAIFRTDKRTSNP